MVDFWNKRYAETDFAYGKTPNLFLVEQLISLQPETILFPCEGEGRNAVYAATKGWKTEAFDSSEMGMKKAQQLATENEVKIQYQLGDAKTIDYPIESFSVIALMYTHFPKEIRAEVHQKMARWLKPGGTLILEAFNPLQYSRTSGGPKDISQLYSETMLQADFSTLKTKILYCKEVTLHEGKFHQGAAEIIRYVGTKLLTV
ncbi:MAG: class I SAM-dependent methyltransferase [Bacteroidetes bacterium]|nr:class I SAM-dependent methyltransferase [Bacteroidota bacterium]